MRDRRVPQRRLDAAAGSSKLEARSGGGRWEGPLTVSGVSVGWTRWPSKRKRTELTVLPWRSQKAPMSFSSLVDFFILKKTSLLLSVTLMFRCSVCAGASGRSAGDPFSCWSDDIAGTGVQDELVDEDRDERVDDEGAELDEASDEEVSVARDDRQEYVAHDGGLQRVLVSFRWLREVVLLMAMRGECAWVLGVDLPLNRFMRVWKGPRGSGPGVCRPRLGRGLAGVL